MRYSQTDEEQHVLNYFPDGHKGSCLSLGENDGTTFSNVRAVIDRGWRGVLVEPTQEAFAKLSSLYAGIPDVTCLRLAVGTENATKMIHVNGSHLGKNDTGLLSTLVESELQRWTGEAFALEAVECVTFDALLGACPIKTFDLISIDIEGMDLAVLRQMDLGRLGCRMLIVEFNGKGEGEFSEHAAHYGMKLRAKNAENLIYTV